ncbi:hypothetical protein GQ53DRAFT_829846 [Thozetella sp. PMI_491]|nr:hypothetical protein GQ53DRAFT_829846 [Thozetella sp. PMI_491]
MRSSLHTPAALTAIMSVTVAAVNAEAPDAKLVARATSIDNSCYTDPGWQSCNGRLTEGPLCVTMTDRASLTACACTSLSIEIEYANLFHSPEVARNF